MAYVSLLLMVAGIIALFLTGRKPRRIIGGLILGVLVVQCGGFLFFSGIMDQSFAVIWILAGLIAGGIFGFLLKLQQVGKKVYYTQGLEFSIIYMLLLLVNQLIAVFFQGYLPIVLFLSALALGLYVGLHLVILMKTRKLMKTITVIMLLCLSLVVPSNMLSAAGVEDETVFQNNAQGLAQASLTNGLDFQFTLPTGQQVNSAGIAPISVNSPTSKLSINSYYPEPMMIIIDVEGDLVPPDGWELSYRLESLGEQGNQLKLDSDGNFEAEGVVRIIGKTWGDGGTQEFDYTENWAIAGSVNQSGLGVRITQPNGNFEEKYFEYPAGFFDGNNQAVTEEPSVVQDSSEELGDAGESGDVGDGNLFALQGVEEKTADLAVTVSGVLVGLAGLIAALGTSLGSLGTGGNPLSAAPMATAPPAKPEPPLEPKSTEPKPAEPKSAGGTQDGDRPPVGSKRDDGKIYTRNNGWQNEEFPGMQANSLKNEIDTLQGDVEKYTQNGDKLRAEIARDQLKDSQRALKKWSEDASDINKGKSLDNEALYQGQGDRWDVRDSAMGTAANVASTISFAADMTLAVGTAGVSSVYSGAKTFGALKNAVSTVKTLTTVKEAASAGANIYDGYTRGKNMSDVLTKEVVNKGISLGVGKVFDAGKEQFGFVKYGADKATDSLKILISTSETSAGNVAQGAFEDLGLNKGGDK